MIALPRLGQIANLFIMTDWRQYLQRYPEIWHRKLCAKRPRVLGTNILDSLAEGATRKQILKSYRSPKSESIDAAIVYAAELARDCVVKFRFGVDSYDMWRPARLNREACTL